jgi:predicted ATPase/class 3 adenylate cyclase
MRAATPPSGTVIFLFSDIEGSTARWDAHSDEMQTALRLHDELVHGAIEQHGGYVFKTVGDAFCASFSSVPMAIQGALAVQRAIGAQDWSAVGGMRIRMALHAGVADERDGDYYGGVVNRIARILATAHGGQVLLSATVADLAQAHLPPQTSLRDLGSHRLRDLSKPEQVYQLVAPGLQQEFPPLRSLETAVNNLPIQLTTFVGREAEAAEIKELLCRAHLVTLVGSGGVGKTRIALQVGAEVVDDYPDGAWLIELAPLVDPNLVPSAIAQVLSIEDTGGSRPLIDGIVMALKSKAALLILDNCEHLVGAAAEAAERILSKCPKIKVLATSREPLSISGEDVYRMPSLAVPPATDNLSADNAMGYGGVALFVERARSAQNTFAITDANAPTIGQIVRRLDGIALAIELAAPRVRALSADQLAQRLDERFKLLTGGSRTALPRQQTLRAMIDWSYELLNDAERSLLRQLAIFRGGCSLEAASEICVDERIEAWDVFELLSSLVDKSLVVAETRDEEPRFTLLETTRRYAQERLEEAGELSGVAARYFRYYLAHAERVAGAYWHTNSERWFELALAELENYRGAIDWGLMRGNDVRGGAAIVASLRSLWTDSFLSEGTALVQYALDSLGDDASSELRGRLLLIAAYLDADRERRGQAAAQAVAIFAEGSDRVNHGNALALLANSLGQAGRVGEALPLFEKALVLAREERLPPFVASVAGLMGGWYAAAGDFERAHALFEEALALHRADGDRQRMSRTLANLAEVRFAEGDIRGALESSREAEEMARQSGSEYQLMYGALNMAAYLLALDERPEAWARAREALDLALRREASIVAGMVLGHLAELAALMGRYESAARLIGYVNDVYGRQGGVREMTEQRGYDRAMEILRVTLTEERLSSLMAAGAAMDEAAAVAEARAIPSP